MGTIISPKKLSIRKKLFLAVVFKVTNGEEERRKLCSSPVDEAFILVLSFEESEEGKLGK